MGTLQCKSCFPNTDDSDSSEHQDSPREELRGRTGLRKQKTLRPSKPNSVGNELTRAAKRTQHDFAKLVGGLKMLGPAEPVRAKVSLQPVRPLNPGQKTVTQSFACQAIRAGSWIQAQTTFTSPDSPRRQRNVNRSLSTDDMNNIFKAWTDSFGSAVAIMQPIHAGAPTEEVPMPHVRSANEEVPIPHVRSAKDNRHKDIEEPHRFGTKNCNE